MMRDPSRKRRLRPEVRLLLGGLLLLVPQHGLAVQPCMSVPLIGMPQPSSSLSVPVKLHLLCVPGLTGPPSLRPRTSAASRPLQQKAEFGVPDMFRLDKVACFGLPEGEELAPGEYDLAFHEQTIAVQAGAYQPFYPDRFSVRESAIRPCRRYAAYQFVAEGAPTLQVYRWTVIEQNSGRQVGRPHLGFVPYIYAMSSPEDDTDRGERSEVELGGSYDLLIEALDLEGRASPPVRVSVDMHASGEHPASSIYSGPQLGVGGFVAASPGSGLAERSAGGYWLEAGWGWANLPSWFSLNGGLYEEAPFTGAARERLAYADVTLLFLSAGPLVAWRDGCQHGGGFVALDVPLNWPPWFAYDGRGRWNTEVSGLPFVQLRGDFLRGLPDRVQLGMMYKVRFDL